MSIKEWTLMFYFASDNPLASTVVSQLKAIKDAGFHPDANVVAQFDPHPPNTPTHIFDVNMVNKFWNPELSEIGFSQNSLWVRDLVLDRLWSTKNDEIRSKVIDTVKGHPEHNPGTNLDPAKPSDAMLGELDPKDSLSNFLSFCQEAYPARHYMLFILGHGQVVGNEGLLYDEHANRHSLTLKELGEVLRAFNCDVSNNRIPGKVELITLHSCAMSAMEVAYELKGAANYLLASQGPTYVGNLPYRQILMRVFNDLNAKLTPADINGNHQGSDGKGCDGKQSLIQKLASRADPVSRFVRDRIKEPEAGFLDNYMLGTEPKPALVDVVVGELNRLIEQEDFTNKGPHPKPPGTNGHGNGQISPENRQRFNRQFLHKAFPEIALYPKQDIETLLKRIFYYCIYNSYDFQLAGYPFDLCLTDLTQVSETEESINKLADALIKGLNGVDVVPANLIPRQLILLAHWDAQSFYREDYVDLYDFCFRLKKRCEELGPTWRSVPVLEEIHCACEAVMQKLEKGPDKMIRLAAFSGAAFQYSHGMSIYFPWTEPVTGSIWDDQYSELRLTRKTRWKDFLSIYFEKTKRDTRSKELGIDPMKPNPSITSEVLNLIGQIGTHVFLGAGNLSKPGPDHPMGNAGSDDSCSCPTIKNYPLFTGVPISEDFFEGVALTAEGDGKTINKK